LRKQRQRRARAPRTPYDGHGVTPVYRHVLPGVAWQLLWWLVTHMDEHGEIVGPWRVPAARDIGKHRIWIQRCGDKLQEAGLIETQKYRRWVRVNIDRFVG